MADHKANSKRVAKNTGIMFARMLLLTVIGLFTSREVLRILGVEDFGIYNLVGTIVVMFSFLQSALNNATTRFITFDLGTGRYDNLRNTFSMSLNSEILLAIIVIVLSEAIGPWFIANKLNLPEGRLDTAQIIFQISLLNFLIGLIRTPFNAMIISHERFDYFAYTTIIEAIAKLGIIYALTIGNVDKLILYASLQVVVTLLIFLWMASYCWKNFKESHYRWNWDGRLFKRLTEYSGYSLLVNVADVAVIQSISILFNIFSGVVANAALGIANQVNSHMNQFLSNFSQSYNPQITKSYAAKDYGYFMKLIYSTSKLSFFLLFAVVFPVLLNIDCLLDLWLSEVPANTALFLCFIAGYSLLDSFSQPLWASVHATGNLKVHQLLMGGIKIMNIPVSYFLLTQGLEVYWILVVYVSLNLLCAVTRIWWLTHLIKLDVMSYCKEVIWNLVKVMVISIPVPLIINHFCTDRLVNLFVTTSVFLIIYIFTIYKSALNEKELELVRGGINRIFRK